MTLASSTPGTAFSAFSTRPTQLAQVMPSMRSSADSCGTVYPAFSIAALNSAAATGADNSTAALSLARFTLTCCTPGTRCNARSTRALHEAQVMPSMGRVRVLAGVMREL